MTMQKFFSDKTQRALRNLAILMVVGACTSQFAHADTCNLLFTETNGTITLSDATNCATITGSGSTSTGAAYVAYSVTGFAPGTAVGLAWYDATNTINQPQLYNLVILAHHFDYGPETVYVWRDLTEAQRDAEAGASEATINSLNANGIVITDPKFGEKVGYTENVPEPSSLMLLAIGMTGLLLCRIRRSPKIESKAMGYVAVSESR